MSTLQWLYQRLPHQYQDAETGILWPEGCQCLPEKNTPVGLCHLVAIFTQFDKADKILTARGADDTLNEVFCEG